MKIEQVDIKQKPGWLNRHPGFLFQKRLTRGNPHVIRR
jgi:hypothetical protein